MALFQPFYDVETFSSLNELVKWFSYRVACIIGMHYGYNFIRGTPTQRSISLALGWSIGESIATRLTIFWFEARNSEFCWDYSVLALQASISLIHFLSIGLTTPYWIKEIKQTKTFKILFILLIFTPFLSNWLKEYCGLNDIVNLLIQFLLTFIIVCFTILILNPTLIKKSKKSK
eukprot:TRINITY_DN1732_c0_g2_i5.p1 TRINITY_DN1732_c0_g2~~TRINITY_DN1732_c0_g2_i5.p1  ORF type:complete len:175 (-),score=39.91 TRINITY_DN1732_c0_g2_i5:69-593(-)